MIKGSRWRLFFDTMVSLLRDEAKLRPMFRPFHVVFIVLMALSITEIASAREKTGLVLSGGGARGFAHVAVLEVLEANQVRIDYIAGTSMGAVIGALYASGLTASEVRDKLLSVDWDSTLRDVTDRNERSFRNKSFEGRNFLGLDLGTVSYTHLRAHET